MQEIPRQRILLHGHACVLLSGDFGIVGLALDLSVTIQSLLVGMSSSGRDRLPVTIVRSVSPCPLLALEKLSFVRARCKLSFLLNGSVMGIGDVIVSTREAVPRTESLNR